MEMDGGYVDGYRGGRLSGRVIQCIIRVHQTLGSGFLESVYTDFRPSRDPDVIPRIPLETS